ncbi:MAG: TonB-dependent receptor [Flavobacteriaceae bacterium]|nr:TonB-dependent receptor [Flavobacteriaceae bacterium]
MRINLLYFIHALFIVPFLTFSQTYTLSGVVKDTTNETVAFANILVLQSQDSTVVTGTSSDENGVFKIEDLESGKYLIKTSFIGYKDNFKTLDVIEDLKNIDIFLEESAEALTEVQIFVEKPTLKREADRLVFNVENTALSQGNLVEVLRSTPSVLVLDNTIMVKNTIPTVYINDRKVHLSSSELIELLQGSSASNIKSVEVITNPSAKYDADSGVVLNIVMSKNLISGYNGSVFSNYEQGVFPKYNAGTSHYFKGDKTNLFFNYSYNNRKDNRVDVEDINYPEEDWHTVLDKNTWSESHNLGFNFDYNLNEKSNLAISANAQILPYYKYLTRSNTDIDSNSSSFNKIEAKSQSRDDRHNIGIDLDYDYQISEASKISFNSHYTNYDYQRRQDVESRYLDTSVIVNETAFNVNANQDTNIFTSQLDYALTINEKSALSTGVKFSNVKTESGILQNDIIAGEEVLNEDSANMFDYDEDVYAAFIDYNYNSEKFTFNAGLRAEQTNITGISSINETNKQDYLEFFPTANLSFQISEKVNSYINYKRSIERPNYTYLNPFVYYLNDNTIVTGNPELRPVFTDKYLIGTTINNRFTFEVFYRKSNNNIFELPIQDNSENIIVYTPLNIDSTEEIGIDFEAYLNITDKWNLYFGSSTYNYNDKGTFSGNKVQLDKWANYSMLSNDFSFLKDNSLTASLTIIYVGENVQSFQLVHTRWFSSFALAKELFKDRASVSLYISDFLNKQDASRTIDYLDQSSRIFNNLDNRYISLGFRYKFGNTKLSTNQRTTSKEERDRLAKEH